MPVIFVLLGAVSFGLGYAMLELSNTMEGVSLFLISSVLLATAILLDRIRSRAQQNK